MNALKIITRIVFPVLIVLVGGYTVYLKLQPKPLPILGSIAEFELTDSQSKPFTDKNLKDKVWVSNFIFTSCSGVCPLMVKSLSKVQKQLVDQKDVDYVSFSVDPEVDTPERLRRYKQKHQIKTDQWHFLTGDRAKIKTLMFDQFKLGFADDVIFHSDRMILVDKNKNIRAYYEGTKGKVYNKLLSDIKLLLAESK